MTNVWDCLLHWKRVASTPEELADADCAVVHEYGDQEKLSLVTTALIQRAIKGGKLLICQHPGELLAQFLEGNVVGIIHKHQCSDRYLDTEEVNRQAADICTSMGWTKVALYCHPHHFWRAARNLERYKIKVVCPDINDIPYDKNNPNWKQRSAYIFVPREILARLLYWWKGWI